MTRKKAIEFLLNRPVDFAHMLGFTKLGDLHNRWIVEMVRGVEDRTLQSSRGTYKTTSVSVALALLIVLLPNERTMFMRKTDNDIKEVIKTVQKILQDPHTQYFVQVIYGVNLRFLSVNSAEITTNLARDVKGTAQLLGIGTGGSLTGKHFDRIFTDDIVNVQDRLSKTERDRTKTVYQELQNIKNRGGRIFNTGTPWHIDDAFSIMPPAEKYDCYCEDVRKIISAADLAQLKRSMLKSLFAANYELRFVASDDVIFADPVTGADPTILDQARFSHIDAAYGGDDSTVFTMIKKTEGKYYVLGKMWHKHVDDVVSQIVQIWQSFNGGRIYCEDNGDKGYLAKELTRRGARAITYHESMNKFLKITSYLKSEWEKVVFVAGTDEEYIRQITDYNENADHDDAPDSLASLVRMLWGRRDSEVKPKLIW